eukprot:Em0007g765a
MEHRDLPHVFLKIGRTNNVEQRRRNLQTGNPYKIEVLYTFQVQNTSDGERMATRATTAVAHLMEEPAGLGGGTEWYVRKSGKTTFHTIGTAIGTSLQVEPQVGGNFGGGGISDIFGGGDAKGPGYVYLMKMQHRDLPHVFLKIGRTNNVEQRLRDLQTGNPYKIEIEKTFEVQNMSDGEGRARGAVVNLMEDPGLGGGNEWYVRQNKTTSFRAIVSAIENCLKEPHEPPTQVSGGGANGQQRPGCC